MLPSWTVPIIPKPEFDSILPPPMTKAKLKEEKRYTLPHQKPPWFTPFTSPWVAVQLKDDPEKAVSILNIWSHPKCSMEIIQQMVDKINLLEESDAIDAIEELLKPQRFIWGTKGLKLSFDTTIVALDTRDKHKANTLLYLYNPQYPQGGCDRWHGSIKLTVQIRRIHFKWPQIM
jgi:hypothetical protein